MQEHDARSNIKQTGTATKFILSENVPLEHAELIPYMPHNLTITELGKQLLKAATDGNVEEIRLLLGKGAPFSADWLGTSPLHLAAQNNHLEVCEILLRAGMSRDARTKVDRTPLHMAAYEGHLEIVECLLRNGADFDCKDLLHMTPLHWAAQNSHAEVAAILIRYGATTNSINKFNLTPTDIATQMNRPDIVQIINIGLRDPLAATEHLALEMICDSNSADSVAIEPILEMSTAPEETITEIEDDEENIDGACMPIETIMIEDDMEPKISDESLNYSDEANGMSMETIENETSYTDSLKLLQQHGITMLPVDDCSILNSVMESGHSVVLTEAGKQALNSIKPHESNDDFSEYLHSKPIVTATTTNAVSPVKKNRIITVTADEFLAMTNGGSLNGQSNILKQLNGKLINSVQKTAQNKRIVMKKNKLVTISPAVNVVKENKIENYNVDSLLDELQKVHTLLETYKKKLIKSEIETAHYKQQVKILTEQLKFSNSTS